MANVGVVGLGYVGMQISLVAVRAGHNVVGYDIDESVTRRLQRRDGPHSGMPTELILELFEAGFNAHSSPRVLQDSDVILLCVPTPLNDQNVPNLDYLNQAAKDVSIHAKRGVLVVNESTSYPGTTRKLAKILELGLGPLDAGFSLAFSSERVDPGRESPALIEIPKVVGGVTEASTTRAVDFYKSIFSSVFRVSRSEEAEMSKLLENTYRQVNIALVNEMLRFSRDMNIDFWEVIEAASTKPFGFQSFRPGPGVGGHCIPIDPRYLSFHVKKTLGHTFRLVDTAQEINDSMPSYVAQRVVALLNSEGVAMAGASVVLIGLGYKAGVADFRGSPAIPICSILTSLGAKVYGLDPFLQPEQFVTLNIEQLDTETAIESRVDIAILLNHFDGLEERQIRGFASRIFDTRGLFQGDSANKVTLL